MIKFITGKPGGGKGLRTMQVLWDHLLKDERLIVTNMKVLLDELQEYCIRKGHKEINVFQRIRLLRPEEENATIENSKQYRQALRNFFLYRTLSGPPDPLPPDTDTELDFVGDKLEEGGYRGTVFMIDEIHKLWPTRAFQKTSNWVLEYCAEHRHFHDDVYFVTQYLNQVDKQIRLLGQDYEIVRNRGKERIGVLAGPKSFEIYTYLDPPQGQNSPVETSSFRLDKGGLCDCYKTAARGGDADKGEYAKGIPWYMLYVTAVAVAVFIIAIGVVGPRKVLDKLSTKVEDNRIAARASKAVGEKLVPSGGLAISKSSPPGPDEKQSPGRKPFGQGFPIVETPSVTGFVAFSEHAMIWLNDGTSMRVPLPEIDDVTSLAVVIRGVSFPFLQPTKDERTKPND